MLKSAISRLDRQYFHNTLHRLFYRLDDYRTNCRPLHVEIDELNRVIPHEHGVLVKAAIDRFLKPSDNTEYFGNLRAVYDRYQALPFHNETIELFPPNVAVLDFLLRTFANRDAIVIDYGCGIGAALTYLARLGFDRVFGYDNFSQIDESTVRSFLNAFGLESRLIDAEKLKTTPAEVIVLCGIPFDWFDAERLNSLHVRFMLIDSAYLPPHRFISGFRRVAEYRGLLTVYERLNAPSDDRVDHARADRLRLTRA